MRETRAFDVLVEEALATPLVGWDFGWLEGRMIETPPRWSFEHEVRDALKEAADVLDLDTGGGEFLAGLGPFAGRVVASEGYPPNAPLAARTLRPHGVPVVAVASAPDNIDQGANDADTDGSVLPFRDGSFELVVNRHSSYWPAEVARILRSGGRFLTQQTGPCSSWERIFGRGGRALSPVFDLGFAVAQLEEVGFRIARARSAPTPVKFHDVGAVVYLLRGAPWMVPDFDPKQDRPALLSIHEAIRRDGVFTIDDGRFLVDAIRP